MKTPDFPEGKPSAPNKRHSNPLTDLFPETFPPVVPASWPAAGTRADEALQAVLTAPQNQADYWRGWRLAAYVRELMDLGWCFIKRDIIKPGCRRVITEYSIDRADPGTAAALALHQKGTIDYSLAGLLAFGMVCLALAMVAA